MRFYGRKIREGGGGSCCGRATRDQRFLRRFRKIAPLNSPCSRPNFVPVFSRSAYEGKKGESALGTRQDFILQNVRWEKISFWFSTTLRCIIITVNRDFFFYFSRKSFRFFLFGPKGKFGDNREISRWWESANEEVRTWSSASASVASAN